MKFLTATDRYIARLVIVPLVSTLVIAAMLLVLDKMLRLFDFVAAEGGPVSVVWQMLANLLPEYLSLGIPIGLLLGILLAFRQLSLSSELDVFRAVGLGYGRLLRVPFIFAIILAGVNLAIVGWIQPESRYAYERLGFELRSGALGASIKVGEFTNLGKNMTIRIEGSQEQGRQLSGIFVRVKSGRDNILTVTAKQGQFMATDDPDVIILRLSDGTLVHENVDYETPRILNFTNHDLPIDLPRIEAFRERGGKEREYTLPELVRIGTNPSTPAIERAESRSSFHFRIVEVVMMLLMPLLAVSLAIPPKRSTSALGVFLSIIMIVAYHKINQYGEDIGALGRVDPIIALWGPFILFAGLIIWMYYQVSHVPGGQPIGALERFFAKSGSFLKGMLSIGRKRQIHMEN
ncbi:LPS export ABC transporter permease LptF [Alterisphingorhabdus coralli]|uniref:LPS export ABC transporter permease LptF n=1 Tax=Alterisphingorhabdus coralli TaxID=3071408 RepID=A0AA97I1V6_9SPHN|nr:LPS export ABC transporter permease LptF [Parasphingorhabdus sp. SCSIO 66989]WOE75705.1 LPS export ABC transporter permease LptF [Parasphingorhabdus sp. SCSIO 66989]